MGSCMRAQCSLMETALVILLIALTAVCSRTDAVARSFTTHFTLTAAAAVTGVGMGMGMWTGVGTSRPHHLRKVLVWGRDVPTPFSIYVHLFS
jgi:hypothetical protein